jgi:hypothetical protein
VIAAESENVTMTTTPGTTPPSNTNTAPDCDASLSLVSAPPAPRAEALPAEQPAEHQPVPEVQQQPLLLLGNTPHPRDVSNNNITHVSNNITAATPAQPTLSPTAPATPPLPLGHPTPPPSQPPPAAGTNTSVTLDPATRRGAHAYKLAFPDNTFPTIDIDLPQQLLDCVPPYYRDLFPNDPPLPKLTDPKPVHPDLLLPPQSTASALAASTTPAPPRAVVKALNATVFELPEPPDGPGPPTKRLTVPCLC